MGSRSAILRRYAGGGAGPRLYRALRLRTGRFDALAHYFPASGLVVDLGCGEGLFSHLLIRARPGVRVLAVDHDRARVGRLRASARGLAIEAADADLATFAIPPCEGIALVDVLHYLDPAAQERVLDRATSSLRAGGVLVVREPDAAAGWRFAFTKLHERIFVGLGWTRARLGRFRAGEEWAGLLAARGLQVEIEPLRRATPYADRVILGRKA